MTSFDMNKEKIEILIKKRIEQNFPNCEFTIENVSHKHKKHKFFQQDKFHLKIIIKSGIAYSLLVISSIK